jgi:hypothetical protein
MQIRPCEWREVGHQLIALLKKADSTRYAFFMNMELHYVSLRILAILPDVLQRYMDIQNVSSFSRGG